MVLKSGESWRILGALQILLLLNSSRLIIPGWAPVLPLFHGVPLANDKIRLICLSAGVAKYWNHIWKHLLSAKLLEFSFPPWEMKDAVMEGKFEKKKKKGIFLISHPRVVFPQWLHFPITSLVYKISSFLFLKHGCNFIAAHLKIKNKSTTAHVASHIFYLVINYSNY